MRAFYRELEYATANIKAIKHNIRVGDRGSYGLFRRLTDEGTALFPHDHFHYEAHHPVLNDGPDLVEIMDAMSRARRQIDDALMECQGATERARLVEDERRFAYGEATFRFYYHLVRTAMFYRRGDAPQARRELAAASREASLLESIVDLVQVASSHANAKNGLDASGVADAYEFFYKKLHGEGLSAPIE
jgi:hypothetical protein